MSDDNMYRNLRTEGRIIALEQVLDVIEASSSFGPCSCAGIKEAVAKLLLDARTELE